MVEEPFERLAYTEQVASHVLVIKDHVYFTTLNGTLHLVRYKLSNRAMKITPDSLGSGLGKLLAYRNVLLVANRDQSCLYHFPLFTSVPTSARLVTDESGLLKKPLGLAIILTKY